MSAKLKSTNKFVGLILQHGEKVVVLLVVAAVGWLVYQTTGRETEDRDPENLTSVVNEASGKIDGFTWQNALDNAEPKPPIAEEFQPAAEEALNPDTYQISQYSFRGPMPKIVYRKDPQLLTPTDLEGHGYTLLMGFFSDAEQKKRALKEQRERERLQRERELERERQQADADRGRRRNRDNTGGYGRDQDDPNRRRIETKSRRGTGARINQSAVTKIQPCAMVLAKTPALEQLKIYRETFENAQGYDEGRDIPTYLGYFVERAEVRGDAELEWKPARIRSGLRPNADLKAVTAPTLPKAIADWAEEMEELVADKYFHPVLTFPLPAAASHAWDRTVIHSDLETQMEVDEQEANARDEEEVYDPTAEEGGGGLFGPADDARGGRPGYGGGRGGMRGGLGGPRGGGPRSYSRGGGEFEEEGMDGGGYGGGGGGRSYRGSRGTGFAFESPYAMLRFIDFNVSPGRSYCYRFQLVLLDVNGKGMVSSQHLDRAVKQRVDATKESSTPFVLSGWSEPSPPISIPLAGSVRVAEAQKSAAGVQTVNLIVKSFDLDESRQAIEAGIEKEKVRPGTVMNMIEKDAEYIEGPELVKVDQFRFRTDMTLLDISGGDKISRSMNAPASVLLMDATGRLQVRTELADYDDVELHRDIYEEDEDARGGGYGGGYEGDMFGDEGF